MQRKIHSIGNTPSTLLNFEEKQKIKYDNKSKSLKKFLAFMEKFGVQEELALMTIWHGVNSKFRVLAQLGDFALKMHFGLTGVINDSTPQGIQQMIQTYTTNSMHVVFYKSLFSFLGLQVSDVLTSETCSVMTDKIMETSFEAIVGAIYLAQMKAPVYIVTRMIRSFIDLCAEKVRTEQIRYFKSYLEGSVEDFEKDLIDLANPDTVENVFSLEHNHNEYINKDVKNKMKVSIADLRPEPEIDEVSKILDLD